MKIHVLTLFPEMFPPVTESSILGRAGEKGILDIDLINIRDYTLDKHKRTDDTPYGGGPGMVMSAQPIFDALRTIRAEGKHILYMSPRGRMLDQAMIEQLVCEDELVILCGHYEGVDQRVLDMLVDEEISVGDFVLTGGELPAMTVIDAVARMIPGVLAGEGSYTNESHFSGLLEYPQYTRPEEFMGVKIPEVLISGHHKNIEIWKRHKALEATLKKRPDMLEKAELDADDIKYLKQLGYEK